MTWYKNNKNVETVAMYTWNCYYRWFSSSSTLLGKCSSYKPAFQSSFVEAEVLLLFTSLSCTPGRFLYILKVVCISLPPSGLSGGNYQTRKMIESVSLSVSSYWNAFLSPIIIWHAFMILLESKLSRLVSLPACLPAWPAGQLPWPWTEIEKKRSLGHAS